MPDTATSGTGEVRAVVRVLHAGWRAARAVQMSSVLAVCTGKLTPRGPPLAAACPLSCFPPQVRRLGITRAHIEEDAGKLVHAGAASLSGSNYSLVGACG